MKKAKSVIFNIIILLIAAAVVFFIGWMQFTLKEGTVGIMSSKTGGLYNQPIEAGKFQWKWERLLPTNVTVRNFSTEPHQSRQVVSGSLPSGSIYSQQLSLPADFTYRLEFKMQLSVTAGEILKLVKNGLVTDQESLDSYLEQKAKLVSQHIADYIISAEGNSNQQEAGRLVQPMVLSQSETAALVAQYQDDFSGFSLDSVEILSAKIPDISLYRSAKASYQIYTDKLNETLEKMAQTQAESLASQDTAMQQLEHFASLLEKYPQLTELSKNGNLSDILSLLKSMQ